MRFRWHGIDKNGEPVHGVSAATDTKQLSAQLAEQKIILRSSRRLLQFNALMRRRLSSRQIDLTLQLVLALLRSGIPVWRALKIISHSEASPRLRDVLTDIAREIESGKQLSESLMPQLHGHNKSIAKILMLGEKNGCVIETLERLLLQRKRVQQIKANLIQAAIYPAILLVISIAVVLLLTVLVIPEFKQTYAGMDLALPPSTRITIYFAELIIDQGAFILLGISIIAGGVIFLIRISPAVKWLFSCLQMRIPVVRGLMESYFCHHFASNLYIAYQSGMPLNKSLAWLPETTFQIRYRVALRRIYKDISHGTSLQQAIKNSRFFPPLLEQIVEAGEYAGSLGDALEKIEQHYDERLAQSSARLVKLLEPLMITSVAICAGWIMITMYLPIFNIGLGL